MEAYYVINNKIPYFYLSQSDKDVQKKLANAYQIWLKEKIISNLKRRKLNYKVFEFAHYLAQQKRPLETLDPTTFPQWAAKQSQPVSIDFNEFLMYARHKVPEIEWVQWE